MLSNHDYLKSLSWNFDSYKQLLLEAKQLQQEANNEQALIKIKAAISEHKDLPEAYIQAAELLTLSEEKTALATALQYCDTAISILPESAEFLTKRIKVHQKLKNMQACMEDLKLRQSVKISEKQFYNLYSLELCRYLSRNAEYENWVPRDKEFHEDVEFTHGAVEFAYCAKMAADNKQVKAQAYYAKKALHLYATDFYSVYMLAMAEAEIQPKNTDDLINLIIQEVGYAPAYHYRSKKLLIEDPRLAMEDYKNFLKNANPEELLNEKISSEEFSKLSNNVNMDYYTQAELAYKKQEWDSAIYAYSLEIVAKMNNLSVSPSDIKQLLCKRNIAHIQKKTNSSSWKMYFQYVMDDQEKICEDSIKEFFDDWHQKARTNYQNKYYHTASWYVDSCLKLYNKLQLTIPEFDEDVKKIKMAYAMGEKSEEFLERKSATAEVETTIRHYSDRYKTNPHPMIHGKLKKPNVNIIRIPEQQKLKIMQVKTQEQFKKETKYIQLIDQIDITKAKVNKQKLEQALENLTNAINLCPEFSLAYFMKASILLLLNHGEDSKQKGKKNNTTSSNTKLNEALAFIEKALSIDSFNFAYWESYRNCLILTKKSSSTYTEKHYTLLEQLTNEFKKSYLALLLANFQGCNPAALERQVDHIEFLSAQVALDQENYSLAIHHLNLCIIKMPQNYLALTERAYCYLLLNNVEAALNDVTKALACSQYPKAQWLNIYINMHYRHEDKARDSLQKFMMQSVEEFYPLLDLDRGMIFKLLSISGVDNKSLTVIKELAIKALQDNNPNIAKLQYSILSWLGKKEEKEYFYFQLIQIMLNMDKPQYALYYVSLFLEFNSQKSSTELAAINVLRKNIADICLDSSTDNANKISKNFSSQFYKRMIAWLCYSSDKMIEAFSESLYSLSINDKVEFNSFIQKQFSLAPRSIFKSRMVKLQEALKSNSYSTMEEFKSLNQQLAIDAGFYIKKMNKSSIKKLSKEPQNKKKKGNPNPHLKTTLNIQDNNLTNNDNNNTINDEKKLKVELFNYKHKNLKTMQKRKNKNLERRIQFQDNHESKAPLESKLDRPIGNVVVMNSYPMFFEKTSINQNIKIDLLPIEKRSVKTL